MQRLAAIPAGSVVTALSGDCVLHGIDRDGTAIIDFYADEMEIQKPGLAGLFKIKLPKIKFPKLRVRLPKIKLPKLKMKMPKFRMKIKLPDFSKAAKNFIKPFEDMGRTATGLLDKAAGAAGGLLDSLGTPGGLMPQEGADGFAENAAAIEEQANQIANELIPQAPQDRSFDSFSSDEPPAPAAPQNKNQTMLIAGAALLAVVVLMGKKKGRSR